MRMRSPCRRLASRLNTDEAGFTMVEMLIAIGIIATALFGLAYTATEGFTYESLARQKQTATGIANQIMEQTRGLAWDKITAGHLASDLSTSTDSNLVAGCAGDSAGTYRFLSCSPNGTPGSGERLVTLAQACPSGTPNCVYPLISHIGQITQNNIVYTWKTYDTNNCPTSTTSGCTTTTPYRITVIVTWTGGRSAPNKIVEVQSLFWSPGGCRSTATHPFAAPCQPFFYGVSNVPSGDIHLAGTIDRTNFSEGDLFSPGVESTLQQEQLSQVQGSFDQSGVRIVDDQGTHTAGGTTSSTSAADTDPGTTSTSYSTVSCGSPTACAGGSVTSSGGGSSITLTAPGGETAASDSTTQAGGANVCPPPTDTAQSDQKACGGSRIQQGGTLSAAVSLNPSVQLGTATLAQILSAANSPDKSYVDRVQYNSSSLCTPINNSDGCVEARSTRVVGTVNVGGLPSSFTAPTNWSGSSAWNGYYISIVGYQDSATAAVGTNSTSSTPSAQVPAPTATVGGGTVYCWNGSSYSSASATSSSVSSLCGTFDVTRTISGHSVEVRITSLTANAASTTISPTAGATIQTDVNAQVKPPSATIQYEVYVDGLNVVFVNTTINLSTLEARGVYSAAPSQGG
ncbi:MAG TPA: prepilin-type N-terminal cleavage/methylation domain-containing protein [Actinomycetota bacterium]|nr:prepilin-type N-terminal cleavage/methylation domain-containing protein [Actinomycetota bacterium]